MSTIRRVPPVWLMNISLAAAAFLCLGRPVSAQDGTSYPQVAPGSLGINKPAAVTDDQSGPVRLARFTYVQGSVTWRTDDGSEWTNAAINIPLREGAQISVANGGRAEVQFDDGSYLRLGSGAVVTLQTLFSDQEGEFTELKQTGGITMLRLMHDHSIYQVDSPLVSVKANGPARFRIGVDSGVEVGVNSGQVMVEGPHGKLTLNSGDYLDLPTAETAYKARSLPAADSWELWSDQRDQLADRAASGASHEHLPPNIGIAAGNLDDYGTWRNDPQYGWVWVPNESDPNWRPYNDGDWTWVNPYGWTWVGNEPWGWAPYHYGTWAHASYGWAWCPGPQYQYWSPAVVDFCDYGGGICWAPLCPFEVGYPGFFGCGFGFGDWGLFFSIGRAGCFYPDRFGHFSSHGFGNHGGFGDRNGGHHEFADNHNGFEGGRGYVPVNARNASGASFAKAAAFGGRGTNERLARSASSNFANGRTVGAPPAGSRPVSGPSNVRPSVASTSPSRTFRSNSRANTLASRSVYRAPESAGSSGHVAETSRTNQSVARSESSGARTGTSGGVSNGANGGRTETSVSSRTAGSRGVFGGSTGSASESAMRARQSLGLASHSVSGFGGRTAFGGGSSRAETGGGLTRSSAAEAAQRARTSLGMTSHSESFSGGRSGFGSAGGRIGGDFYHPSAGAFGGNSGAFSRGNTGVGRSFSQSYTGARGGGSFQYREPNFGSNRGSAGTRSFGGSSAGSSGGGGGFHGGGYSGGGGGARGGGGGGGARGGGGGGRR